MRLIFFVTLFLAAFSLHAQQYAIFISPSGNDGNPGTKDRPVASIEKAHTLVRYLKKHLSAGDSVTVYLRAGKYRLAQGIVLEPVDGGTKDNPVIYRSYDSENAIITGAVIINKYKPLSKDHPLYKKNPDIGKKIIVIDLQKAGLSVFRPLRLSGFNGQDTPKPYILRELYFNGKPMPLSRWPDKGFSVFTGVVTDSAGHTGIVYRDPHILSWTREPNILLHGYWKYLWADAWEQVAKIDTANRIIWLTPPYNHYKFSKDHPFAAHNVITEIDRPGEWAYDYKKKVIYFYPPEDPAGATLELSLCKEPLLTLNKVRRLTFRDIHFEMGAGPGLVLSGCSHIRLDGCEINGCARDGILVNDGNNITLSSCTLYDMGRGGIRVVAGNRETLEGSGVIIDNCHIHHLSRIDRTYTPGVWLDGVGTTVRHCRIHDVPSSAMRVNGNDHIIEYNEIYHTVTESDDQGAIDMWGDPTYRGNIFRYNYIHDIGPYSKDEVKAITGRAGIRFDDAISGNVIYGNVLVNCSGGHFGAIQIHGGKENLIENNIFYRCTAGISFTPWSTAHWLDYTKKYVGFLEKHKKIYLSRYPRLSHVNKDLNKNTVIRNVFLECGETTLRQPKEVIFKDNIILPEYPGPGDPEKDHYSLKNIADDLKKIGFEAIPFEEIGQRK